jgi:hypothetical protein
MKTRFLWLLKRQLVDIVMISRSPSSVTGYSLSLSPLKQLVYFCLVESIIVAPSSNVIIICGVLGGRIGGVSSCFGNGSVLGNGSLLLELVGGLIHLLF